MDSDDDSTNENNSGLLRYRSAPSSFLANFCSDIIGADDDDDHHHKRVKISTIETETQWFMTSGQQQSNSQFSSHVLKDNSNDFALNSPQLPPHPQYPRSNAITQLNGGFLFRVQNSNLMRQNSSPAGFFSHLSPQNANGYAGSAFPNGASTGTSAVLSPSSNRISSGNGIPSNLGMMLSRISESENENPIPGRTNNINIPDPEPDHQKLSNASNNRESQLYCPPLPFSSRNNNNNSSKYSHNFTGFKTEIENDHQGLFSDNHQGGEPRRNRSPMLSHHLSLPKISGEIVAMEKLLQFRDTTTVPCKIRAKRGCATHPRSIAERVRRTRISERMKKLQELVPNMDKQTNTADMLDLAVHYIKDLRKQYKTLSEFRANCKCSDTHKSVSVVDHEEF